MPGPTPRESLTELWSGRPPLARAFWEHAVPYEGTEFRLDHGEGEITVEMAGWEWYEQSSAASAPLLNIGERVTVTGPVDEEFYRARKLEARTVYVEDRDTIYTASPLRDDENAWDTRPMPSSPLYGNDPVSIRLAGQVAGLENQQFSLTSVLRSSASRPVR